MLIGQTTPAYCYKGYDASTEVPKELKKKKGTVARDFGLLVFEITSAISHVIVT